MRIMTSELGKYETYLWTEMDGHRAPPPLDRYLLKD